MKISSKNRAGFEDGPEEGEIISDDLEDISDVSLSLTPRKSGKSHYDSANLVGLSLSSVSDSDETTLKVKNRRKRKKCCAHRAERQKMIRRKPPDSDSSDDDSLETCRLKLQLKATVQLDSNDPYRNSLKNRLRAMIKSTDLDSDSSNKNVFSKTRTDIDSTSGPPHITIIDFLEHDTSSCVESVPENIDNNSNSSKDDLDNELIHLRLEALKTAIQNKYPNGVKSKKLIQDDTNKENSSNNSEKRPEMEMPQVSPDATNSNPEHKSTTSPEEDDDVDVLRALLLASMARKMTDIDSGPQILPNPTPHQKSNSVVSNNMGHQFKINNNVKNMFNNIQKCVSKNVEPAKQLTTPPVKPLIICVNSESDSEWEASSSSPGKSPKKVQNVPEADVVVQNNLLDCTVYKMEAAIESTIEKFLKEQREKVEHLSPRNPEQCKTIVNVPKKITATTTSTESNTRDNVAKSKAKTPITALPKTKMTASSHQLKKMPFSSKITPGKAKIPKNSDLEKSALKFLPASKREEYRKLQALLRQKKAQLITTRENKSEKGSSSVATAQVAGRFSQKPLPVRRIPIQVAKTKENSNVKSAVLLVKTNERISDESTQTENLESVQLSPKTEARLKEFRSQELLAEKREKEKKQHTQLMRNILKQLQTKCNGRLQMEDKYKCLRPLIKELNGVNKEQKDCDQEIEKLINQVTEIRKTQESLHKQMMKCIKELADKKANIDLSITTDISQSSLCNVITSTPIKLSTTNPSTTLSELCQDITMTGKANPELYLDTKEQDSLLKDLEFMDNKEYIIDPNDIDQVIKKTQEQVAVLERKNSFDRRKPEKNKYISPLDSGSRQDDLDPFAIVCPFEVNGTCKDPDCSFNHLPK